MMIAMNYLAFYCSSLLLLVYLVMAFLLFFRYFVIEKNSLKEAIFRPFLWVIVFFIPIIFFINIYNTNFALDSTIFNFFYKTLLCSLLVFVGSLYALQKKHVNNTANMVNKVLYLCGGLIAIVIIMVKFSSYTHQLIPFYLNNFLSSLIFIVLGILSFNYYRKFMNFRNSGILNLIAFSFTGIFLMGINPLSDLLSFLLLGLVLFDTIAIHTLNTSIIQFKVLYDIMRSKILFKYLFLFTFLIILALEITTISIMTITRQAIVSSQQKTFVNTNYQTKSMLYDLVEKYINQLKLICKSKHIISDNSLIVGAYLFDTVNNLPALEQLKIIHPEKKLIILANRLSIDNTEGKELTPYEKEGMEENLKARYFVKFVKNKLFIAYPIFSDNDEYLFSVAGEFNLKALFSMLLQIQQLTGMDINIINSDNFSVNNNQFLDKAHPLRTNKIVNNSFSTLKIKDKLYLAAVLIDPKIKLTFIAQQPEEIALAGIKNGERISLIILVVATIVFVIIGFIIALSLEKPIKQIHLGLVQYRAGHLEHQIVVASIDEFGQLANSLNDMALDLKGLITYKLKSEQLATISQLAVSLGHEINNPLATIITSVGFMHILAKKMNNEELLKVISIIKGQSERIKELVANVASITEPIIEGYVNETKMIKINFRDEEKR